MKLWAGRFSKDTDKLAQEFCASISFDRLLFREDIWGSLAHAKMLGKCGILEANEAAKIIAGLKEVCKKIEEQAAELTSADEDIHMNVERLLTKEIGELAGKLHTARSRNDQVATDLHLYLRTAVLEIIERLILLGDVLAELASKHQELIMPGYTHLQRAQPVLFSQHLSAYAQMFTRDLERFKDSLKRINVSPLGSGALAGTTFPIDREYVAKLLKFDAVYENSMDAVSDRDFIVEFLSDSALLAAHLSRLSEELILWSSSEFGFIEIDDAFATGSSMMPQKKNPDVAELIRGKTGRIYGALIGMLTVLKGLPLTYNKDLQEDKEGLFDTVETIQTALTLMAGMLKSLRLNPERMQQAAKGSFSNATDLADYFVRKGMPFRESHSLVGRLVALCIERGSALEELTLSEYQEHFANCDASVFEALKLENVVSARKSSGGTAPVEVKKQLEKLKKSISEQRQWLSTIQASLKLDLDQF